MPQWVRVPFTLIAITLLSITSPANAAPGHLLHLSKYMSARELLAHHPGTDQPTYHNAVHSLTVAQVAQRLAAARGLSQEQARLVGEIGLLHDWDPGRPAGTPARVPETLRLLQADFDGKAPLLASFTGRSVLKERFHWGERELKIALAMIQRSEFPFGDSHPSPVYQEVSPRARYVARLKELSPADRAFAATEGPMLSEFADKASFYMRRDYKGAALAVDGLVNEINASAGAKVVSARALSTATFLRTIGRNSSFEVDHGIAKELGLAPLPLKDLREVLAKLPLGYGTRLKSNLAGFAEYEAQLTAGASEPQAREAAALTAARAARRHDFKMRHRAQGVRFGPRPGRR